MSDTWEPCRMEQNPVGIYTVTLSIQRLIVSSIELRTGIDPEVLREIIVHQDMTLVLQNDHIWCASLGLTPPWGLRRSISHSPCSLTTIVYG